MTNLKSCLLLELSHQLIRFVNKNMKSNKLINEQSPYLLQHAHNPVDWFPWGQEAFQESIEENKPIFLSIGYSTCHWCHVMEKESFEDFEVANILNEYFISIKVDREERPDVDSIYMTTCQMMTGRGGWPLSIFLTPDKKPFFAGTYFPKDNRYGRMGFKELLLKIADVWKNNSQEIIQSANEITSSLKNIYDKSSVSKIDTSILHKAFKSFEKNFDNQFGGFGTAPKFPSPHNLTFLLRYSFLFESDVAQQMAIKTLQAMRNGGIYDHIGFGFHRYSTDQKWLVPHFEKMLYDQASLIIAYSELYQVTKNDLYKKTVYQIIEYLTHKMQNDLGGFYSAEDADSEGVEGKFYVWSYDEIKGLLSNQQFLIAEKFFSILKGGNYFDEISHRNTGKNILHVREAIENISSYFGLTPSVIENQIEIIRPILFEAREKRIHPFKDDKVLTDWNGLMIAALSIAGRILNDEKIISMAKTTSNFILSTMLNEKKELLHRYRNGSKSIPATLDDYSFLIWGLIELYQSTFDFDLVNKINSLTEKTIELFYDQDSGGFYFSQANAKDLIIRTKDNYDGAIPSGNSVMIYNLIKLNSILFENKFGNVIEKSLQYFSNQLINSPSSSTFLLSSFMNYNYSNELVIIFKDYSELNDAKKNLSNYYLPFLTINAFQSDQIPETFSSYKLINDKITFYYCVNFNCNLPTNDFEKLIEMIFKK